MFHDKKDLGEYLNQFIMYFYSTQAPFMFFQKGFFALIF